MRLGDLDALKEAIRKRLGISSLKYLTEQEKVIVEEIDNAPSVFDCRSCKNNGNERECINCHDYSNYVHYEERSQCSYARGFIDALDKAFSKFDANCTYSGDSVLQKLEKLKEEANTKGDAE